MPFVTTVPVRFHQVDSARIVFFGRIFEYAHDAYEAWMRGIGFPLEPPPDLRGYGLPLAHAEADFQAPIRLGDEVRVELSVAAIGSSSFTIAYALASPAGTPYARVRTVHVCIEPATGRSCPLPARFREVLEAQAAGPASP